MNSRQKLVQQAYLDDEEAVIKNLKSVYNQSLKDITEKSNALQKDIEKLAAMYDEVEDEAEKARLQSMQRSKVYQKQYQDALKKQVSDILDTMQEEEFKTVASYLDQCYEQGFLGTMYDLQGQGIPLCFPLDQEAMVRAVQLDSKISQGLYSRLGEDVDLLKKNIAAQVSRGISTGMTYGQVAQQLAGCTNIGFNNAVRIARTEGHRIQVQAGMDACYKAKEKGADVVKQWDATLDGATRESHVHVDGEIKELDEKFSNGLRFPGDPSGGAAEVVNCRCALLQRARWALKEKMNPETGELYWEDDSFTKMNNVSKEIVDFSDIDDYNEFKNTYLKASKEVEKFSTIENKEQARTVLEEVGFKFIGDGINLMDEEQSVVAAQRLQELESRFGCAKKDGYTLEVIKCEGKDKNTYAYVRNTKTTGNNLVLNSRYYGNSVDELVAKESKLVSINYSMPCNPTQLKHYTITHEYGHMVENMVVKGRIDQNVIAEKVQKQVDSFTKMGLSVQDWQIDNFRKRYEQDAEKELKKTIWEEIKDIGKEQNSGFTVKSNISDYGKTNFDEAFAESFANALCGEPNELGNAMNIWLERQGF